MWESGQIGQTGEEGLTLKKTKIPPPPKFIESEKTWSLPKFS